jgi:hypothetical protein
MGSNKVVNHVRYSAEDWRGLVSEFLNSTLERHSHLDSLFLLKRKEVYEAAKSNHPERWSGSTRNCQRVTEVHLNPLTNRRRLMIN